MIARLSASSPPRRLVGRVARKIDSFWMPRKPGVERNHQIGHFDDVPRFRPSVSPEQAGGVNPLSSRRSEQATPQAQTSRSRHR